MCPDNGCSHLMICLLVKYHLERGESGPALALLSINRSAASTSQPSILDSEDSNYFNCATSREKHVCGIVVSAEKANSDCLEPNSYFHILTGYGREDSGRFFYFKAEWKR